MKVETTLPLKKKEESLANSQWCLLWIAYIFILSKMNTQKQLKLTKVASCCSQSQHRMEGSLVEGMSVRPSVPPSVRPSVRPSHLKNDWPCHLGTLIDRIIQKH